MNAKILNLKILLLLSAGAAFFFACSKNETEIGVKNGLDYFPLQIGKYKIFQIDSVAYHPLPGGQIKVDSFRFQLKETIADTFTDNAGVVNYRIERLKRPTDSLPWTFDGISAAAVTRDVALRTDNNLTFIKVPLTFITKTSWSGDILIDSLVILEVAGENIELISKKRWNWQSDVESYGKPEQVGAVAFPDVATVLSQTDSTILTEKRYWLEKYAKNVGLVYKQQKIVDSQNLDNTIPWEKRAQKGYILKQTIVSFN